jgi:putative transposase
MENSSHHPPHILIDESWYFITAHTAENIYALRKPEARDFWTSTYYKCCQEINVISQAFVVLDNHYHILCYFKDSSLLPRLIHLLHGRTSYYLNKLEDHKGRKVWHNYWDRIIRNEEEFWTKFNYIHYNPVKHGHVSDPVEWIHSSYRHFLSTKGYEWIADCFKSYPIIEYDFEN